MRKLLNAALATLLPTALVMGQGATMKKGDVYTGGYAAASFFTNRGPHFALLHNRQVWMTGFRRERLFSVGSRLAWATTMELPVSIVLPLKAHPDFAECWWRKGTGKRECYSVLQPGMPVGAIGLTPLGIKAYLTATDRVRFFGSLAGGGVAFDRRTPVAKASAINFAAEYLLGADVAVSATRSLEVAWKFQHWSNANLSYFNPGLDANLITLGLRRRR